MKQSFKPQGYASVSAYIMVDGAQQVIDFLTDVFDAKQLRRFDAPDGSVTHVEVQIDDTVVMFSDASQDVPAFPVWLHVYVPDVDATYQRALDTGAPSVKPPDQQDGIDRRAAVKDPAGNTWWIATQLPQ
ncbi:MAG: VOC family protein [Deinococcota bacterium]